MPANLGAKLGVVQPRRNTEAERQTLRRVCDQLWSEYEGSSDYDTLLLSLKETLLNQRRSNFKMAALEEVDAIIANPAPVGQRVKTAQQTSTGRFSARSKDTTVKMHACQNAWCTSNGRMFPKAGFTQHQKTCNNKGPVNQPLVSEQNSSKRRAESANSSRMQKTLKMTGR